MPTFTASRLSSDNTVFPDRVEIEGANITYYKGNVFGYQSTVIARQNIASVYIGSGIFFADVIFETMGGRRVVANGFKKAEAREIVRLLT
jgi:hypothetical protein